MESLKAILILSIIGTILTSIWLIVLMRKKKILDFGGVIILIIFITIMCISLQWMNVKILLKKYI